MIIKLDNKTRPCTCTCISYKDTVPELRMDSTVFSVDGSSISSLRPYVGMTRLSKSTISNNPLSERVNGEKKKGKK